MSLNPKYMYLTLIYYSHITILRVIWNSTYLIGSMSLHFRSATVWVGLTVLPHLIHPGQNFAWWLFPAARSPQVQVSVSSAMG